MAAFTPKKVSKVKAFDADSSFSIEGMDNGSFAVASSKKELKQLMTSDAAVVYDEKKGKLYFNENGEAKGWGAKKVGGLLAKFKGKPELSAEQFDGLSAHSDAVTGGGGSKALKGVIKDGKKDGYIFDRDELAEELTEMNKGGAFSDIELDAAALDAMFSQGGEQEQRGGNNNCCQEEAHEEPWGRCPGMRPMRKWLFGNHNQNG